LWLFCSICTPTRFLVHATLFPCAACRQADLDHSLDTNVAPCPWNQSTTSRESEAGHTVILVNRQQGPDLVDRFWLNGQTWFHISPRSFVNAFITGICLALISGYLASYSAYSPSICVNAAFYVTMRLTFAAADHTPVKDSPKMMNLPLKKSFPDWRAAVEALPATFFVHLGLVFVTPNDHVPAHSVIDFLTSILFME